MSNSESFLSTWAPRILSVLRIVAGFLFLFHGSQKLFNFPPSEHGGGPLQLLSMIGVAGILEFFGGVLLLIGLFTRPVAFILSGEMAAAYFMAHAPNALLPIVNHGDLAALLCFLFLYFVFAGGGLWSLDHLRHSKSS